MAQLAGEGSFHHRWLFDGACGSLHRELGGIEIFSIMADDRGNSVVDSDGGVHGVSLRAGKSARHVAEPAAAAASLFSGDVVGFGNTFAVDSVAPGCDGRTLAVMVAGHLKRDSPADGLG